MTQQEKPKKKMTKADWIGMVGGLFVASIIFQMGSFGFIPAFLIAMVSYWVVKKIALSFIKENKVGTSDQKEIQAKTDVVQQTETMPIKNKGSKKKWIWIGIGIFVLIIIISIFSSSNVPNENISLLKTDKGTETSEVSGNLYRNTKYNFRIKFPENWDIKVGDGPNIVQKAVQGNNTISVGVKEIPAEYGDKSATIKDIMTLAEYKDSILEGVKEKFPGAKLLDYGETKLDNISTYWVKYSAPYSVLDISVEGTNLQYQLLHENILYFITAGTLSDEFSSSEVEFKKSIATFVTENY